MTLNGPHLAPAHREMQELREENEELNNAIELLKATKAQQEQIIRELSQLVAGGTA
jgi:predicted  nucleic acid-binding Zn-ribbon protein